MGASTDAGDHPRPYACFNFLMSMHPTKTKTKTINENENPKRKPLLVLVARSRFRLWFSFWVFDYGVAGLSRAELCRPRQRRAGRGV
ncbi:MAG TPA: hypothetical protein VKC57_06365, partial [Ktedonobacterales bacterium]|nr:hypothetical protein [Ktedonobacterales bacterium]